MLRLQIIVAITFLQLALTQDNLFSEHLLDQENTEIYEQQELEQKIQASNERIQRIKEFARQTSMEAVNKAKQELEEENKDLQQSYQDNTLQDKKQQKESQSNEQVRYSKLQWLQNLREIGEKEGLLENEQFLKYLNYDSLDKNFNQIEESEEDDENDQEDLEDEEKDYTQQIEDDELTLQRVKRMNKRKKMNKKRILNRQTNKKAFDFEKNDIKDKRSDYIYDNQNQTLDTKIEGENLDQEDISDDKESSDFESGFQNKLTDQEIQELRKIKHQQIEQHREQRMKIFQDDEQDLEKIAARMREEMKRRKNLDL